MKPLARARGESGESGGTEVGGGATLERGRTSEAPATPRASFVRRRDSAPVHPTPDEEGVDVDGDGFVDGEDDGEDRSSRTTPSAPPEPRSAGARRRATPDVAAPMSCPAPLPPWADARARRKFTLEALPNDGTHARCHVLRKRGPFGVFPTYVLYLDGRETTTATLGDAVPILVARKRKKSKCTHYVIGDDGAERAVNEAHASYVGKLKANFIGTHFELLDSGVRPRAWGAPRHLDDEADDEEQGPPRRALANIRYAVNVLGAGGPRALSVSLLGDDVDDPNAVAHELESARPTWNPSAQAYVLNFNGRVTRPSVKNFQLVSSGLAVAAAAAGAPSRADAESRTLTRGVLQFGRVDDDLFTLDFAHPLSPLTAFAACLSAFESKFARE